MPMQYMTLTVQTIKQSIQTIKQSIQTIEQSNELMGALGDAYAIYNLDSTNYSAELALVWVTNWSFTDPMYVVVEGILKDYPNPNMSPHHQATSLLGGHASRARPSKWL
ncbi:hypothetical protein BDR04DRAFT_1112880 [Suillus decipiens]|nr:hypothetical protein BDR04DRAFT_1112880 [Suillus decipiens]